MVSATLAFRRGGLFRDGSHLRLDYVPSRGHSLTAGFERPIFTQVPPGRTRPFRDHAPITGAAPTPRSSVTYSPELTAVLAEVRDGARRIRALTVPFLGRDAPPRPDLQGAGPGGGIGPTPLHLREARWALASAVGAPPTTLETAASTYHDALDRAFSLALCDRAAEGARVAAMARQALLDEVLLPYDRLLGQTKRPDSTRPLARRAELVFRRRVGSDIGLDPAEQAVAVDVFREVLDLVEESRSVIAASWKDSRFVWLPLQLALRPEEHDSQAELDALVARAVEVPFTEGNFVSYVINEQFQYQLSRTIRAAEEFHVLWTHDFRGVDDVGDPDEMAFRHVVRSYLAAMTERVRAFDRTGTFPTYVVIHDQWYYSVRKGRLFLELLEDPTRHQLRLPRAFSAWGDTIRAAQAELRAAIAGSARLQEGRRAHGDAWLRDLVKVHVSVTNRSDETFRSWRLIRGVPVADNMLRDHRKIVFYDLSEDDPYRGEAMYTGAGVGEHYSNLSWEDRSLLVRGPALLGLKAEARSVLVSSGLDPKDIPYPLRARPMSADYDARVAAAVAGGEWPLRAISVQSGSGYASKSVNVAKAVLYTMMPAGSVIMVPDSFWASEFWGAALFGASLRGARVLVIAPSNASNSVEFFGTQLLTRELLSRMLVARAAFAGELAATGGQLRVGIFDSDLPVADIPGKVAAVRRTFESTPWLRELFGFPPDVYADLNALEEQVRTLATTTMGTGVFEYDQRTKLHLKANHFASREAWNLMTLPNWGEFTWSFVTQRIAQVQNRASVMEFERPTDPLLDIGSGALRDWYDQLDPAARERVVFYTVMGSQNQNFRSMVTDAEDAFIVARWPSVIPYLDAIALVGQSHWVASQREIDEYLPPVGRLKVGFAHWARLVH
jgi:phosphatidylserine/phosphatidylglycerophosphate/cardiolipin synthase-like enzyme